MLDYNAFTLKHDFSCHPKQIFTVISASGLKIIMTGYLLYCQFTPILPSLYLGPTDFKSKKCTNVYIRHIFNNVMFTYRSVRNNLDIFFDKFECIRTSYLKLPLHPKIKETHFKVVYDIYPSGELLRVRFNFEMILCKFCNSSPDNESLPKRGRFLD